MFIKNRKILYVYKMRSLYALVAALLFFLIYKIYKSGFFNELNSEVVAALFISLLILSLPVLKRLEKYLPTTGKTIKDIFGDCTIETLDQIHNKLTDLDGSVFRAFNPSIALTESYRIISYRISNIIGCPLFSGKSDLLQRFVDKDSTSYIVLSLKQKGEEKSFVLDVPSMSFKGCISGFEDPRLITSPSGDTLYIVVNCQTNDKCYSEMHLMTIPFFRLVEAYEKNVKSLKIDKSQIVKLLYTSDSSPKELIREKNWMPFFSNQKLMFVYSVNPHIILEADIETGICKKIAQTENKNANDELRGSSQARPYIIENKNVYIAVGHVRHSSSAYFSQVYAFSAVYPYEVLYQSPLFVIENTLSNDRVRIQFVSGLAIEQDTAYITYGEDDCESKLLTIDMNKIVKKLEKIPPGLELAEATSKNKIQYKRETQKIPKVIFQTNEKTTIPVNMKKANDTIIKMNPEYAYIYFSDVDAKEYIKKNYSGRILQAYERLKPGAYKADLFRYCILNKEGGVYIDTGFIAKESLENVIKPHHEFVSSEDDGKGRIYNAFIASIPGHPILKKAIDKILQNVETQNYGRDYLDVTGPSMLGDIFKDTIGEDILPNKEYKNGVILLKFDHNREIGGDIKLQDKVIFITKYPNYYEDQKLYNTQLHYGALWRAKDIFN